MAGKEHSIERGKVHYKWDNSLPPAIEINPGDVVHLRVGDVVLPLEELAHPGELGLVVAVALAALLVPPVRRDAVLGEVVHVLRAHLDLDRLDIELTHAIDDQRFGLERLDQLTEDERKQLREANKRIRLLEQENEVLRRAAAYLSQANLPGK